MSDHATGQPVRSLIECAMSFRHSDGDVHVYLVKGILGPAPFAACCNVCQVDVRTGDYAEPEVVSAESGTLTDLFRRVESVLTGRHPACQKVITFDFTKEW